MQLRAIVRQMTRLEVLGSQNRPVSAVTADSRKVTPGAMFVAVPGTDADGHDFIPQAIERGATTVVFERQGFIPKNVTGIRVEDSRTALAQVAAAFYRRPSTQLKVIGVTGTNGKTTVAFMIKSILERAGMLCGLIGTIQYEIGERMIPAHRTTPDPVELQQLMGQMVQVGCQACVMEVSSHALDQKRVAEIEFDVGIFTNLTQDHLDYHGSIETYYNAKKKLFTDCASLDHSKPVALINIDDFYGSRLSRDSDIQLLLTYGYGFDRSAKFRAAEIQLETTHTTMKVEVPDGRLECAMPMIGRHNVYNALAAIGAAAVLQIPGETIEAALSSMMAVPGRLETVNEGQPFTVLVDYAHTEDALSNVLATVRELSEGKVLLVFGCGGSRDQGKRKKMGEVAARLADATWITSDNPRREAPDEIAAQVLQGYRLVRDEGWVVELGRSRAIQAAISQAEAGDVVLIAGKGHETYQEFDDAVVPFDDRVHAREVLDELGWTSERLCVEV